VTHEINSRAGAPPRVEHRLAYATPTLRQFGSLAALTKIVGNAGTVLDGGSGSMKKTS
jgi:hypothetical protein